MKPETLVLGTAYGYGVPKVRVFVESLRRHYAGPAALVVSPMSDPALFAYLHAHRIQPVTFACRDWMPWDLQVTRYVCYLDFLLTHGTAFEHIFLTDVGDVLFQGDPFAQAPDGELVVAMEDPAARIGRCDSNASWVRDLYGEARLEHIADRPISCSGTTLGKRRALLRYLDCLLGEAHPDRLCTLPPKSRGHDQGMHNVLLHEGRLPGVVMAENGTYVLTIGQVADASLDLRPDGIALVGARHLPPVVHQYQYKAASAAHVARLWPTRA